MADSLSPDNKNPLSSRNPAKEGDTTGAGMRSDNLGDTERGLQPPGHSYTRDTGPMTPERVHEDHLRSEGTTQDYDAGNVLPELTDDELSRLSILASGESLQADDLYYDLNNHDRGPFTAAREQKIGESERIVARSSTDEATWNRLVGKRNPSLPES